MVSLIGKGNQTGQLVSYGRAECSDSDTFDLGRGVVIALGRALKAQYKNKATSINKETVNTQTEIGGTEF